MSIPDFENINTSLQETMRGDDFTSYSGSITDTPASSGLTYGPSQNYNGSQDSPSNWTPAEIAQSLRYTGASDGASRAFAQALSLDAAGASSGSTSEAFSGISASNGGNPNYFSTSDSNMTTPSDQEAWTTKLMAMINGVGDNVEKNKEAYKMITGGISGAFAAKSARERAEALAQSRLNELSKADALKQGEYTRNGAAITGMKKRGIINSVTGIQ